MSTIDLNIAEDFLAQVDLEQPATTTGIWAAATGLSSVSFRIALTRTGSAVGSLTGSATERSATAGRYYAVFDAATLTADLAAYVGTTVFLIVSKSGDIDCVYFPLLVTDSRDAS